jgi:hypothetical protein
MTEMKRISNPSRRKVVAGPSRRIVRTIAGATGAATLVCAVAHSVGATTASAPLGSGVACVIAGTFAAVFTGSGSVRTPDRPAPRPEARTHPA